jgi:hypothetical protein
MSQKEGRPPLVSCVSISTLPFGVIAVECAEPCVSVVRPRKRGWAGFEMSRMTVPRFQYERYAACAAAFTRTEWTKTPGVLPRMAGGAIQAPTSTGCRGSVASKIRKPGLGGWPGNSASGIAV